MKHIPLILLFAFSSLSIAQEIDSVIVEKDSILVEEETPPVTQPTSSSVSKWYYGGTVGFSFWNDYTYIGIYPLVGYKVTPKFSIGGKIGYSYYNYHNTDLKYLIIMVEAYSQDIELFRSFTFTVNLSTSVMSSKLTIYRRGNMGQNEIGFLLYYSEAD